MNKEKLFEAIGELDDSLVTSEKRSKRVWLMPAVAAACMLIAVTAVGIKLLPQLGGSKYLLGQDKGENTTVDLTSESYVAQKSDDVTVYYVSEGGTIESKEVKMLLSVENIFAAWKEANGIDDAVAIERTHYLDNGQEYYDGSVAGYIVPTYFEYEYTLSDEFKGYENSEGLIESLEKTLREYLIKPHQTGKLTVVAA